MAKRKVATQPAQSRETAPTPKAEGALPDGVEMVTIQVPMFVGRVDRPRRNMVQLRMLSAEEDQVVHRLVRAYELMARTSPGELPEITMSAAFRKLLLALA